MKFGLLNSAIHGIYVITVRISILMYIYNTSKLETLETKYNFAM